MTEKVILNLFSRHFLFMSFGVLGLFLIDPLEFFTYEGNQTFIY